MRNCTVIDGCEVEVEDELTERVACWIAKGRASASLAALQAGGVLSDDDGGGDVTVAPATIDKITAWAEANGY